MSFRDPSRYVSRIVVEEGIGSHPYTREILKRSNLPVEIVPDEGAPEVPGRYPDNLSSGKKILYLCKNRGKFFKPCPATREYQCCEYHVLNIGMNCPMDCVYCILQAYLNNPWLSFFVNVEDLFAELDDGFARFSEQFFRIGTGEFTDSMALDRLTGLSKRLVEYMRDKKNGVLELKTKSAVIDNLKGLDHGNKTVVSWSLNSPAIMKSEEIRTASLDERLQAAATCADWGYRLAFHFDPIIHHENWRQGYRETIAKLFSTVPADRIAWISMGALRYLPPLKNIATGRFPGSRIFYDEFIGGLDGKSRYFRTKRLEMYQFLVDELAARISGNTCLYFCMESDVIWKQIFGFTPSQKGGLAAMLDRTVR